MAGQYFYPSGQNAYMRNSDSLPPGWEMLFDQRSGWPYFVDHNTHSTTWQDPRMGYFGGFEQPASFMGVRGYPNRDFGMGAVEIPVQHESSGLPRGPTSRPHQQQQVPEQPVPAPQHAAPPFHIHSQPKDTFSPEHASHQGHPWAMHHNHPPQGQPQQPHYQNAHVAPKPGEGAREIPIHHVSTHNFPVNQPQPGFHGVHTPQPQEMRQDRASPRPAQQTVYTIPVRHETARAPSPRAASPKKQYSSPPQPAAAAQQPAPQQLQPASQSTEEAMQEPPKQQTVEERAFEIIDGVMNAVKALEETVKNFKGMKSDKDYKYIEEMLTRNLLKLDSVDADGHDNIRLARKNAVRMIEAALDLLELKAHANQQVVPTAPPSRHTRGTLMETDYANMPQSDSTPVPMETGNAHTLDLQAGPQSSNDGYNGNNKGSSGKNPGHVKEMVLDSEVSC